MYIEENRKNYFIRFLMEGKREIAETEATKRINNLQLSFLSLPLRIISISPIYISDKYAEGYKDEYYSRLIKFIEGYFSENNIRQYTLMDSYENIQVIISGTISDDELEKQLISLNNSISSHFGIDSFIGVGNKVNQYSQLSVSYNDAREMLGLKYQYSDNGVVMYSKLVQFQNNFLVGQNIYFERVIGCFLDCNIGRMSVRLDELVEHVRNRPNSSRTSIKRTLIELAIRIINIASNAGIDAEYSLNGRDPYHWILSQDHTEIITEWILEISSVFIEQIKSSESTTEKRVIKKACLFIDRNLHDNSLGLQTISDYVELSQPYLSQLFKSEVGNGISSYIVMKRVERAEYLLKHTPLKVEDISRQCGFSTVQYFSKIFKKHTDMTPVEFRKS